MIDETSRFIVFDQEGFVKCADRAADEIEYTEDRDQAQVFQGLAWADYWTQVPGTMLIYVNTPAQQMAASGAARLPGTE